MKERIQGSKQIKINTFPRKQNETADDRGCLIAFNPFRLWDGSQQARLEVDPQLREFYQASHDVVTRMGLASRL